MASSTTYQTVSTEHGAGTDFTTSTNPDDGQGDTSLQPYPTYHCNSDSLSHSNLSINDQYQSIESYNKNNPNAPSIDKQQQQQQQTPKTPTPRSSSPIPVLLRSASSVLSRSMRLPPGSLRASTFTVITGMVGGGTFTFSYGIYKSGMIPGIIYLVLISSLAGYSTHAIVFCAECNNCPSFRRLAKKLYGKKTAIIIQLSLILLLWMACISYMTLTKNLLSQAISSLLNDNDNDHWYDNDILLLLLASILPTYLALQRKVSALRYASLFGLTVVIFSMILVVETFLRWCPQTDPQHTPSPTPYPTKNINESTIAPTTSDIPGYDRKCFVNSITDHNYWYNSDLLGHTYTIALFFGGFAAQFTVLPIYFEMQKRSPRNMTKCIASGFGFTFFIYLIVAFFGYWTFPNLTDPVNDQNLITLYNNDTAMLIAQILLALYVMSIIPLFAHAFRKSLNELIAHRINKRHKRKKKKKKKNKHNVTINNGDHNGNNIGGVDKVSINKPMINNNNDDDDENEYNDSLTSINSSLSDLDEDKVNDTEIIEDAIANPHLAYVPVSPEAKKLVEENMERRERKGTLSKTDELELPTFYHALVTLLFLLSVFGVAIFAQNIGQVNSIISSTTLPICCFIFPCMCAMKTDKASFRMKAITLFMAIFSVFNAIMFFYNLFTS